MDLLPPTAPSLVLARETYTPYWQFTDVDRANRNFHFCARRAHRIRAQRGRQYNYDLLGVFTVYDVLRSLISEFLCGPTLQPSHVATP